MQARLVDETDFGFGWIHPEPRWMQRASHALAADGRVWVLDATLADGVEERIRALGEPAGVVQLLDRHARDCAELARRLGVPHHVVPSERVAGAPFEVVPVVRRRTWREIALWWPEREVLAVADAVAGVGYYRAGGEVLGVSPLLRPTPPRVLCRFEPEHVLCGHGEGVHGAAAAEALHEAVATARWQTPHWLASLAYRAVTRRF